MFEGTASVVLDKSPLHNFFFAYIYKRTYLFGTHTTFTMSYKYGLDDDEDAAIRWPYDKPLPDYLKEADELVTRRFQAEQRRPRSSNTLASSYERPIPAPEKPAFSRQGDTLEDAKKRTTKEPDRATRRSKTHHVRRASIAPTHVLTAIELPEISKSPPMTKMMQREHAI
jgi:hypothetical protein